MALLCFPQYSFMSDRDVVLVFMAIITINKLTQKELSSRLATVLALATFLRTKKIESIEKSSIMFEMFARNSFLIIEAQEKNDPLQSFAIKKL
jgi:hypothetical protein